MEFFIALAFEFWKDDIAPVVVPAVMEQVTGVPAHYEPSPEEYIQMQNDPLYQQYMDDQKRHGTQ